MKFSKLTIIIILLFFVKIYSQKKYIVNHENGKIKIEGYITANTFDSIYKEYYNTGILKIEGVYKNCEYKTNHKGIYIVGCGVESNLDTIKFGKKQGVWKTYYENGKLSLCSNFHCGIIQGNQFSYDINGKLESIEFYNEGHLMYSQDFNSSGIVIKTSSYEYKFGKNENFKKINSFEFYDNGDLKSNQTIEGNPEKEDETFKEYYSNGFLKLEKHTINGNKLGIYREYYENGNVKYEGLFKDNNPLKKQYFYNENGSISKIESWKNNKLVKTQILDNKS
ncbi:MORN repeat variant [Flavobacterium anhuiense]|uniref:MORN repeat variant n=1 Tax=Flavobacterium anhuiense TaxID=459526 RepID=A0AAC9D0Y3_9FLAO|nr:hypothetical protein [Flavobacterium anhuiense]AOC94661.1 MORN repeat variant [Flavobacterium anhuiense]